jgi:tetratricopeptide (TPR) repeat protein
MQRSTTQTSSTPVVVASTQAETKPSKPDTIHLRNLLNQSTANGLVSDEAAELWIEYADHALNRNDRITIQLLLQLLDKISPLPPLLLIYREYCQGMLATLKTDAGAMQEYFSRGLELVSTHAKLVSNSSGAETSNVISEKIGVLKAILQINLANAYVFTNEITEAENLVLEALPVLNERGLLRPQVRALTVLFKVYYCRGQIEKALNIGTQALTYARQCDDQYSVAKLLQLVGISHLVQNSFQAAREHFEEALALSKIIGHNADLGTLHNNLAIVYERLQSYKEALATYETALTLCTARGDKLNMVVALNNIGSMNARLGHLAEAHISFTKGIEIARENAEPSSLLLILSRFASHLAQIAEQPEASHVLAEALHLYDQTETIRADYQVEIYRHLCRTCFRLAQSPSDCARAYSFWQQTVAVCQQLHDQRSVDELAQEIAEVFLAQPQLLELTTVNKTPVVEVLLGMPVQPLTLPTSLLVQVQPQLMRDIYQLLAHWWENFCQHKLLINSNSPLEMSQVNQVLNYVRTLFITGEIATAIAVYRTVLPKLIYNGSIYSKVAAYICIEAARLAQPAEAIELLEEFLVFTKTGLISQVKPKEVEALLKAYRKQAW